MKKYFFLLCFFLSCYQTLSAYKTVPVPFKVGEYMEFNVRLFNKTVAVQKVWVKDIVEVNGVSCYHIYADIETVPVVSAVYRLHDQANEYIDVNTLHPVKIYTKIKEGSWTNTIQMDISQEKKTIHYVDKRSDKEIKYDGDVLGLISLLFFTRTVVPDKNEKITFTLSNGDRIDYINAVVSDVANKLSVKELKKVFKAILYNQIGGRNVALWIGTDKYRLPIRMISVRLKLAGYGITNIEAWLVKHVP
ncbi:MAG: DUF3108 domain-containing protein [bacterium]|nr:DUF3108 domain-containing protein [bacterium]